MLCDLLGRFFRHCIAESAAADLKRVQVREFEPDFMTDQEISDFLHGRPVEWGAVAIRKRGGLRLRPCSTLPELRGIQA